MPYKGNTIIAEIDIRGNISCTTSEETGEEKNSIRSSEVVKLSKKEKEK
jgi:hypothetical protein